MGLATVDDTSPALPQGLRTLDYGNSGTFLTMGNAGFISSAVSQQSAPGLRAPGPDVEHSESLCRVVNHTVDGQNPA